MPTKYGRVTSFGRRGPKFTEAFLESGERVELSPPAMEDLLTHNSEHALVFVERRGRLFHYVQWIGTPDEAIRAVESGVLRPNEVPPGVRMIGEALLRIQDGTSTLRLTALDDLPAPETEADRFLAYLNDAGAREWLLMARAHASAFDQGEAAKRRFMSLLEESGQRGLASGRTSVEDVDRAKATAEAAADRALPGVIAYLATRSSKPSEDFERVLGPTLRSAANAITTLILIRPFLTDAEAEELWEPYKSLMPEVPGAEAKARTTTRWY
jgi:hypothetical protein